jgi:hypothetical protein
MTQLLQLTILLLTALLATSSHSMAKSRKALQQRSGDPAAAVLKDPQAYVLGDYFEKHRSGAQVQMRFVGTDGDYGEELDLTKDWAVRIIRHVGNYGEVYERNADNGSKLGIPRGLNQLWNAGGILYAPPIR